MIRLTIPFYSQLRCFRLYITFILTSLQAVEKALKAARIKMDADYCNTHNLRELYQNLNGIDVAKVDELVRLCVRSEAMRYPDCHHFPSIPHDVYRDRSEKVVSLAAGILASIKRCMSY